MASAFAVSASPWVGGGTRQCSSFASGRVRVQVGVRVRVAAPRSTTRSLPRWTAHAHGDCCQPRTKAAHPIIHVLQDARHSLRVALASGAFLVLAGVARVLAPPQLRLLTTVPLLSSILLSGLPAAFECISSLIRLDICVDVLMTLAAAAAIATGSPFEGAMLLVLYAISHTAESKVAAKARGHLDALRALAPATALLVRPSASSLASYDNVEEVPIQVIAPGDLVLVRQSQLAPCDGLVQHGTAFLTLAHITGESTLHSVGPGDTVPAGARAVEATAPFVLKVLRVGEQSTVGRIARLVTEAQKNKGRLQTGVIDRFGRAYSRTILAIAVAIAVLPTVYSTVAATLPVASLLPVDMAVRQAAVGRALGFLVAASPCALVVGAPVAYVSALSACARRGVLVKGGAQTLEAMANVRHIAFDKTGTLTTGKITLSEIEVARAGRRTQHQFSYGTRKLSADVAKALSVAAALEVSSVHPVGDAILATAQECKPPVTEIREGHTVPGQGMNATLLQESSESPRKVAIGRWSYIESLLDSGTYGTELKGQTKRIGDAVSRAVENGESVSCLLIEDDMLAVFRFSDVLRPEAVRSLADLRRHKKRRRLSIVTGDNKHSAKRVASALEFPAEEVFSEMRPEEKVNLISHWRPGMVMVGDSTNDAPALAAATTGVSMGLSSATTVFASDVILAREDLRDLDWLLRKATATEAIALQNVTFGLALMVLAATPAVAGILPLWMTVLFHEGSTVLVGLNGLRLLSDRLS